MTREEGGRWVSVKGGWGGGGGRGGGGRDGGRGRKLGRHEGTEVGSD